jgi:hypothetical protein
MAHDLYLDRIMPITAPALDVDGGKLDARSRLIAQHDRIRAAIRRCIQHARGRIGEPIDDELDMALTRLRAEWWDHDKTETALLREILSTSRRTPEQVERMIEDHLTEHAHTWAELCRPARFVIAKIEELCVTLEAHMVGEERTFLSLQPIQVRTPRGTTPPRA